MHNIEVIGTQKTVLLYPENGQELNREQFINFSRLLFLYQTNAINFHEFKVKLTYALLNLVRAADLKKPENDQVTENINQISKLAEGFFTKKRENGKEINVVNMDFYIQVMPTLSLNNKVFHGPDSALFNTVYGEYLQVINYLTEFSTTGNEEALNLLVATIYRPAKPDYETAKLQPDFDGDIRIPFNPALTNTYAETLGQLPFHVKYAVFLFVASCQHFIANNNALDIGGGNTIDLTILFKANSTTNNASKNSLGMVGTLYSLAETQVFGNVKEVAKQNTYDILAYLVNQTQKMNQLNKKSHATTT